jgi:hypothetical protein
MFHDLLWPSFTEKRKFTYSKGSIIQSYFQEGTEDQKWVLHSTGYRYLCNRATSSPLNELNDRAKE